MRYCYGHQVSPDWKVVTHLIRVLKSSTLLNFSPVPHKSMEPTADRLFAESSRLSTAAHFNR
jgi:hypothetical protein